MLSDLSIHDPDRLCQYYLHNLYEDIERQSFVMKSDVITEKHGEVLYAGVRKMLSAIRLSEQDVFYDLGSGLGKVVLQVFLMSCVKEVCGIEINSEFYEFSLHASQKLQMELPDFFVNNRKITFNCGNFLEVSLVSATVIFINSMCFSPVLLHQIVDMINRLPGIHTVISLRPLIQLKKIRFIKTVRIQCSWDAALCYIYQR